ncbi:MAG TPA: hypothetical protein VGB54_07215 [Allosphingosinicella sp.]|jgi:hypothetical protein
MKGILIGATMALLQWLCVDLINGYAVVTAGGLMTQFSPPNGFVFYYGVYAFAAILIGCGLRRFLGGQF